MKRLFYVVLGYVIAISIYYGVPAVAQQQVPMPAGMFWLDTAAQIWRQVSQTNPLPVNIVAGGGSGTSAVYGPTASGSASVNPPVQIGGTVTGAAGQNVAGAAVKPASTAAVATDTSVVTQLNPNSPGIIANAAPGTPNTTTVLSVQGESGMTPVVTTSATTGGGFPNGATQIQGNATGSTGAVVGTLAAAASKFTWLCDFDISAFGTGAVGPITIAGLLGGSKVYQYSAVSTGATFSKNFAPCLQSSAVNTAITITTTADANTTAVDVNSSGYQQ
jgi:hypothetical protein